MVVFMEAIIGSKIKWLANTHVLVSKYTLYERYSMEVSIALLRIC